MIEKQFGFYFYLKYDFALFLWFSNYLYETQYPFWLFKLVLAYFFLSKHTYAMHSYRYSRIVFFVIITF